MTGQNQTIPSQSQNYENYSFEYYCHCSALPVLATYREQTVGTFASFSVLRLERCILRRLHVLDSLLPRAWLGASASCTCPSTQPAVHGPGGLFAWEGLKLPSKHHLLSE